MADVLSLLNIPITKVDEEQRLVYGVMAREELDKANEIFDYDSSRPYIQAWSDEIYKATDGKSYGNLRVMHDSKTAAGLIKELAFDDENKMVACCGYVEDDAVWRKVASGTLNAFSIGGKYVNRTVEKGTGHIRYTAKPSEVSLVDNPCMPGSHFTMVKSDGSHVEVPFVARGEGTMTITNDQVVARAQELAKDAGVAEYADYIAPARADLEKNAAVADTAPGTATTTEPAVEPASAARGLVKQVWTAPDGKTFEKKADAVAHADTLDKPAAIPPVTLDATLERLAKATDTLAKEMSAPATDTVMQEMPKVGDLVSPPDVKGKAKTVAVTSVSREGLVMFSDGTSTADWAKDYPTMSVTTVSNDRVWSASQAGKAAGAKDDLKKVAATPEAMVKSMYDIGRLACLIEELSWLQKDMASEAMYEGDGSTNPVALKSVIASLIPVLRSVCEEETSELFKPGEDDYDDYAVVFEMAASHGDTLAKFASTEFAGKLPEAIRNELQKAGARNSKADLDKLQAVHDHAVSLGAKCDGDMDKAASATDDLAKAMQTENAALKNQLDTALVTLTKMAEQVEAIAKQSPSPRMPVRLQVVEKNAEGRGPTDAKAATELLKSMDPAIVATAAIGLAQRSPMVAFRRGS